MPRIRTITKRTLLGAYKSKVYTPFDFFGFELNLKRPYLTKNPNQGVRDSINENERALSNFPDDVFEEIESYYSKNEK